MLELYNGALDVQEITNRWLDENAKNNFGALVYFVGIIRDEDNISALSFDIYEPILKKWFNSWQEKAKSKNAKILMAHSIGEVKLHKSSYISAICSPKRRVALEMIDEFVEDFKKNAPIWKYDIINDKKIYAQNRSTCIEGSGILN